jgi:uncharacterized protein (DUF4213/DUF364 family)
MVMEILNHILSKIDKNAPVDDIVRGLHWTAVVSRFCGLSSTTLRDCAHDDSDDILPLSLTGRATSELALLSLSTDIGKASLGLATINSLISLDLSRCMEVNAVDILMEKGKDRNVSIIGHFPFVDDFKGVAKNLWVIEKRQKPGDYPEEDASRYLPQSDVIAISSTTLINHTLEGLLSLCPEGSFTMLLGPTTPMTNVMFDYGIDMISGILVIDQPLALTCIKQGANFRQLKRSGAIKLLTMEKY